MAYHILGIDIGGTKCAVVLGSSDGENITVIDRLAFATPIDGGPEAALIMLDERIDSIIRNNRVGVESIRGLGISCGGPLDSERGVILSPPNLPGWDEVHITDHFHERLGLDVQLQNDANACALAEWRWGAGRGSRNMVFLTFGTGLGAGLILDGKLYTGANDQAGEVGHIRLAEDGPIGYGKHGSFEGFCSGGGISRLAESRLLDASLPDLAEKARNGDKPALDVFMTSGCYLGLGLSMLVDILNPDVIVIGSVFARAHDLLWPAAQPVFEAEALPLNRSVCRVVPAQLGDSIGDYACLSVALECRVRKVV